MTLRVRFHHHLGDVTIHEACQLWCAVCFKIIYMGIIITTGKAKASIIPTRFLFCTDLVCWKIDSVFVLHRLGFCQKSTRFLSKIDSVFLLHRLDPLKIQLGFCRAPTWSAEKSTQFLCCTDSVCWKIGSVFVLHRIDRLKSRLGGLKNRLSFFGRKSTWFYIISYGIFVTISTQIFSK